MPTETKVESGTSQSKSGTSVNLSNSGVYIRKIAWETRQLANENLPEVNPPDIPPQICIVNTPPHGGRRGLRSFGFSNVT